MKDRKGKEKEEPQTVMRHGKAVTNGARQNESFPLPVQVTAADVARERSENSVRGPNRGWIDYITRCLVD